MLEALRCAQNAVHWPLFGSRGATPSPTGNTFPRRRTDGLKYRPSTPCSPNENSTSRLRGKERVSINPVATVAQLPPRLDIAALPTRIVELRRWSQRFAHGQRIFVKRDDDTGGLISGNKIRKLQYAVRQALDLGADVLLTRGGIQSNHCRSTAAIARAVGMDIGLVLRGEPRGPARGNLLRDRLLGAKIRFVDAEEYAEQGDELLESWACELREQGKVPYVIGEGCSMPIGTWGYVEAAREIAEAQAEMGLSFDAIVCAAGSGGTSAGLILGREFYGLAGRIVSFNVCDDPEYFRDRIGRLLRATVEQAGSPWAELSLPSASDIEVLGGYEGVGYARVSADELRFAQELGRSEGILLDPVYTGKAFKGMCAELDGRLADAKHILFVHTGGLAALDAYAEDYAQAESTT